MDPHDWSEKYFANKSQDDLDLPVHAKLNLESF